MIPGITNIARSVMLQAICGLLIFSCGEQVQENAAGPLADVKRTVRPQDFFKLKDPAESGLDFVNTLVEDKEANIESYVNVYNGGGVALGDLNNDGLMDVYFTGNRVDNKLYLNEGNLHFKDITESAGVGSNGWSTGVCMVDINLDGFLDIYVCRALSHNEPELRRNLLYINNGDLTFTEMAAEYGIDDMSYSTQALFIDHDLDGDLDLYVGNHPYNRIDDKDEVINNFFNPIYKYSDKFFINNGDNTFSDATKEVGIFSWGYMLGIAAGDINRDGWPDIYIANDHAEPDFLYMNNKDGTFTNVILESVRHMTNFSMGIDLADFNNDGYLDLIEVDMLAEDNYRQKTQMSGMNPEMFWYLESKGYGFQYMRNILQVGHGNGKFSEVGQMAGIANTDWSWAALFFDFDNNGFKDLFISNGYKRDIRENDFNKFKERWEAEQIAKNIDIEWSLEFMNKIPSTKINNYFFKNMGDLRFEDISAKDSSAIKSFSNGAAYGDLDNDGDLDLVVNNVNDPAFIYENLSIQLLDNHFLRLKLHGPDKNPAGLGTKISLYTAAGLQYQEYNVVRGFQSSVEPYVHFGLGPHSSVDALEITWQDGNSQRLTNLDVDQVLDIYYSEASPGQVPTQEQPEPLFTELNDVMDKAFVHKENIYDDFQLETLLPHKMSQFGPNIAVGDVNGDGLEDFFIGGAIEQGGALYVQVEGGQFNYKEGPWIKENWKEDMGAAFFDADQDGDMDLYVVSGGNEYPLGSPFLEDRLYINNGQGGFRKSKGKLPFIGSSGSCVVPGDYDQDGDMDLFIGGRVHPGTYPFPAASHILENQNGVFKDVTRDVAPQLLKAGLVSSAVWSDFDQDGQLDLIIVGEWMPITVFRNQDGRFKNMTENYHLENTTGWWNKIVKADFDGDGDEDYVLGNLGLNYKYKASTAEPLHIYCHDFDNSGSLDIVLGYYNQGICYPVRGRECSSEQMPNIKAKFPTYDEFGKASLSDVYGADLQVALHYQAKYFSSTYMENVGSGNFALKPLPTEAQFSTVFGIIPEDFDGDGELDLLISGNFFVSEVETGRADASYGLYMKGLGKGDFVPMSLIESGFEAKLDVRDMQRIMTPNGMLILVANNNDRLQVFRFRKEKGLATH